jgi:hypothetical protein
VSDQSLRDALEKLIQEWRYTGADLKPWQEGGGPDPSEAAMDDCANELKRVLAACAAEPVQVEITDEAREAMYNAVVRVRDAAPRTFSDADSWDVVDAAVEAVRPYLSGEKR